MALSNNSNKTQTTTKKTRTHIIKMFTKNVLKETPKMILYKFGIDRIWLPKTNLWINSFLTDYFILPVYETDKYEIRVHNENDEKHFSTCKTIDLVNEVLTYEKAYEEFAVVEKSTNK